jgi:hypothetical protein
MFFQTPKEKLEDGKVRNMKYAVQSPPDLRSDFIRKSSNTDLTPAKVESDVLHLEKVS